MASWKLPLGEMKEIVSTIAQRAGLDDVLRNTLWKYIERMPEALQSSWVNSFGDVSSPGLADARRRALTTRIKNDHPSLTDEQVNQRVQYVTNNSARDNEIYGDILIRHPKIGIDATTTSSGPIATGYITGGSDRRMMFSADPRIREYLPNIVIHEGTHYMDKARGIAKDVHDGNVLKSPRFESVDWLPDEAFKLPTRIHDVEQAIATVRPEQQKKFVLRKFAPIRSMGMIDYKHTDPTDIAAFANTCLKNDDHGFYYFVKKNDTGDREVSVGDVAAEGLAQWLEFLPTYEGLSTLPISKKIIERIEDDPRRGFNIDFDAFMKE